MTGDIRDWPRLVRDRLLNCDIDPIGGLSLAGRFGVPALRTKLRSGIQLFAAVWAELRHKSNCRGPNFRDAASGVKRI